jgi:hypothetical protein
LPLRARRGDADVYAFDCDLIAWEYVKRTYKTADLRMPCCDSLAIPKTSKLGNFFFSHARRGECTTAPESAEHVFLKTLVAKAAVKAGWIVTTEKAGTSPQGADWAADVLCVNGRATIALEIQLSYQTVQELKARQETYASSGVRAAWFASGQRFKAGYLSPSQHIPFFVLPAIELGCDPLVHGYEVTLSEFVIGMLSKRLSWKSDPWEYGIHFLRDQCWVCGGEVSQVFGWSIDVYGDAAKTVPNMSTVLEKICDIISNDELRALGLNTIGKFERLKGNAPGFPYCNVCIRCGAPQNNHYIMKKIDQQRQRHGQDDPSEISSATFLSPRESTGWWHYALCDQE